jgi:hypothetical protein
MMPLTLQTPPAFHVQPFHADPSAAKHGRWVFYLGVGALFAALLNLELLAGARSAGRSSDTGVDSALGDWVADLDKPEL